jgi:RNA polymerase sigma factor (sigma-70 family)
MPHFNGSDPAFREFMKCHERDFEAQAIKLSLFYRGADIHDIISRTITTLWDQWHSGELSTKESTAQRGAAVTVMQNHARNLSRKRRREWERCRPVPDEDLRAVYRLADEWHDISLDAVMNDNVYVIYRAISRLPDRQKDVMALLALGLSNASIAAKLGMTTTNFTSTLSRARNALKNMLRQDEDGERALP